MRSTDTGASSDTYASFWLQQLLLRPEPDLAGAVQQLPRDAVDMALSSVIATVRGGGYDFSVFNDDVDGDTDGDDDSFDDGGRERRGAAAPRQAAAQLPPLFARPRGGSSRKDSTASSPGNSGTNENRSSLMSHSGRAVKVVLALSGARFSSSNISSRATTPDTDNDVAAQALSNVPLRVSMPRVTSALGDSSELRFNAVRSPVGDVHPQFPPAEFVTVVVPNVVPRGVAPRVNADDIVRRFVNPLLVPADERDIGRKESGVNGFVPLHLLRYYQDTVSATFSNTQSLARTVGQLRAGTATPESIPRMRVLVCTDTGVMYAMTNRRLTCYDMVYGVSNPTRLMPVRIQRGSQMNPRGTGMSVGIFPGLILDGNLCTRHYLQAHVTAAAEEEMWQ
jgi:hypothetical protein